MSKHEYDNDVTDDWVASMTTEDHENPIGHAFTWVRGQNDDPSYYARFRNSDPSPVFAIDFVGFYFYNMEQINADVYSELGAQTLTVTFFNGSVAVDTQVSRCLKESRRGFLRAVATIRQAR